MSVKQEVGQLRPKLSYAQGQAIIEGTAEWQMKSAKTSWPTLDALKRRGLVETRYSAPAGSHYRQWQWRLTAAGMNLKGVPS